MWETQLGALRFVVEHRNPGPLGGPTLRVHDEQGRERLRFDCFARGAHWHSNPHAEDEISSIEAPGDPIDWVVDELRRDARDYLSRVGLEANFVPEETLDAIESSLRNPPLDLDGLDLDVLRRRSGEKWRRYDEDVLACWVADMDFPVAESIARALRRSVERSDFGYPVHPRSTGLADIFAERMRSRFEWEVEPRSVELMGDVVQGIHVALEAFSEPGDGIVIQTPIYPPFLEALQVTGRRMVENPLAEREGGYVVDLDGLRKAVDEGTRLLLLCNPHNPSGRALTRTELTGIAEVVLERDLWVVSDEIHQDLVFSGTRHIPFASLSADVAARTLTLTSATKAFNVAGLRCAVGVLGSPELRRRFLSVSRSLRGGLGGPGLVATASAWTQAQPWLDEVLAYLESNRDFVGRFLKESMPGIRCHLPEATYLAWLDCRDLGWGSDPSARFLERGRVALSPGPSFGARGEGFARLNFATSRPILTEILERMARALQ